jgi:hypothetical protein
MSNLINFVFLEKTITSNGNDLYGIRGPFLNYIFKNNLSYSVNLELKNGYKNIIPIELQGVEPLINNCPEHLIEFIKNNDVKLMLISLSDPLSQYSIDLLTEFFAKNMLLDYKKIIILNSNIGKIESFYKHCSLNYFLEESTWDKNNFFTKNSLGYTSEEIQINELDKFRNKKFICYNRNIDKVHRFALLDQFLSGKFDDSYFSFLRKIDYSAEAENYFNKELDLDFYNSKIPIELDTHNIENKQGFVVSNTFKKELFLDSCINIVTETTFYDNQLFISEKIIKPLINYQPFIIFGPSGYLTELKKYGFKTFSDFWDEGYDLIEDPFQRLDLLLNLVKSLNNKSIEEINDIYRSTKEICIYNRDLFYKLEIDSIPVILEEIDHDW